MALAAPAQPASWITRRSSRRLPSAVFRWVSRHVRVAIPSISAHNPFTTMSIEPAASLAYAITKHTHGVVTAATQREALASLGLPSISHIVTANTRDAWRFIDRLRSEAVRLGIIQSVKLLS